MAKRRVLSRNRILATSSNSDYLLTLLWLWLPGRGWFIAAPVIVCAAVGVVVDVRWLIVALALVLVVAPMLMAFFYIYYMLTPEARRAALPRVLEVVPGKEIRIHYHNSPAQSGQNGNDDEDRPPLRLPPDETIPWSQVKGTWRRRGRTVYLLRGPRIQFIIAPDPE